MSKDTETVHPLLAFARAATGPGFCIGGLGLMQSQFIIGVIVAYVGFLICFAEACFEPLLRVRPWPFRMVAASLVLYLCVEFTLHFVVAGPPPRVAAYSTPTPESAIAGIQWSPKFTDLEVAIDNPTQEDFQDLNFLMVPDGWVAKAIIEGRTMGCELSREDGDYILFAIPPRPGMDTIKVKEVFGKKQIHDSLGSSWKVLATKSGYRLICDKLRSHSKVDVRFISVSVDPTVSRTITPPGSTIPDGAVAGAVFLDQDMEHYYGPRPFPSFVRLDGTYRKWSSKIFSAVETINVDTEN